MYSLPAFIVLVMSYGLVNAIVDWVQSGLAAICSGHVV